MQYETQGPTEEVLYGMRVTGDTISSAAWTLSPAVTSQPANAALVTVDGEVIAQAELGPIVAGNYTLACLAVLASGQKRQAVFRITVS